MKNRSIKKLLIILSENKQPVIESNSGLCWLIVSLMNNQIISFKEKEKLNQYIDKECKKDKLKEYYYLGTQYSPFYFPKGKWSPRLKWLKMKIKELS